MMSRLKYLLASAFSLMACHNADVGRENTQNYIDSFRPSLIQYASDPLTFYQGITITPQIPEISAKRQITSCTSTPALPAGLSLDNETCKISGTPTGIQSSTPYTITATNDMGSLSIQVNILIGTPPPSNLVYTGSPFAFVKSKAITTITPTFTGTITSCSASPPLPGLTLNSTTCAISGTPTNSQLQTTHTITASNAFGNTQTTIDLTIFRVLFGSRSGIAGSSITSSTIADNFCNADGNKPASTGSYKAMIVGWGTRRACSSSNCTTSGAAENLDWVLAPDTEYRQLDLVTKIMTTNSSGIFVFGALSAGFLASSAITSHWTGLNSAWVTQGTSGTCGGSWSTGASTGAYGTVTATNSTALFIATGGPCSSAPNLLVCAQQ